MTMLPAWYFTCCVRAREEDAASFLAILRHLARPLEDERLVLIALNELRRTEIWMQVYATPAVLRAAAFEGISVDLAEAAISYFVEQLERLAADEPRQLLTQLVREVVVKSGRPGRLDRLQPIARHLLDQDAPADSGIPYLDLKDRLGETLLLAALSTDEALIHDLRPLFQQASEKREETPLETLIEQASRGEHGRLALLQATRLLAHLTGEPRRLAEKLWQRLDIEPEFEPDLINLSAELSFTGFGESDADGVVAVQAILRETVALLRLRQLKNQRRSRRDRIVQVLGRMGLSLSLKRQQTLTGILWHTALWRLAAQANPSFFAREVARLWRPTGNQLLKKGRDVLYVRHASWEPEAEEWFSLLASFFRLRDQTEVKFQYVTQLQGDFFDTRLLPYLFSPWLVESIFLHAATGEWRSRYDRPEDPLLLLRLLDTGTLACDLLAEVKEPTSRTPLLELVVHADRVLDARHGQWLAALERRERLAEDSYGYRQRLPDLLGGLALFVRRRLQRLGQGHVPQVEPQEFVALARIEAGESPAFWNSSLPRALVSWIHDAMSEFAEGRPPARWREHVPYICQVSENPRMPRQERLRAALLWRFLGNGDPSKREWDDFDWRNDNERISPRQLLLGRAMSWRDWLDFDIDRLKAPDELEPNVSARLALAVERVAALSEAPAEDDAPVDAGITKLVECLWEVSEPKYFDRFLRLRLLELLDRPLVLESYPLQRQICHLILQFGSVSDWLLLIGALAPYTRGKTGGRASADARLRLVTELPQLLRRTVGFRDRLQRNREYPEDPERVLRDFRQKEVLRDELARILYFTAPQEAELSSVQRADYLRADYERLDGLARDRHLKATAVLAPGPQGRAILSVVDQQSWFRSWMIQAVLRDPTDDHYTVLYGDYNDYGIGSFFHGDEPVLSSDRSRAGRYLGFVLESHREDLGKTSYRLNCGLPDAIEAGSTGGVEVPAGEAASVPLEKDRGGSWRAVGKVMALPTRRAHHRQLSRGRITERTERDRPLIVVEVGGREERFADWRYWDPDLSRAVDRRSVGKREVFVEYDETSRWLPVRHDLLTLIARELHADAEPALTLTFIERTTRSGLDSFIFSRAPGLLYELTEVDFLSDDLQALQTRIEEEGDATGLLVALSITIDSSGNPRIALLHEPQVKTDLEHPFDDRNLRWRDAFTSGGSYIAYFDEEAERWFIPFESAVRPFDRVEITAWKGKLQPSNDEASIEAELLEWTPRTQRLASAEARALPQRHLSRIEGETEREMLDRILGLERGSNLRLETVVGSRPTASGFLSCATVEGLSIWVVAESLTMRPLGRQTNLTSFCTNRWARLLYDPWEPPRHLKIAAESLPPEFEQMTHVYGILESIPRGGKHGVKSCVILYRSLNGASRCRLPIDNFADVERLNVGSRVTIDLTGDEPASQVENLQLQGSALWEATNASTPEPGALFLGDIRYRGRALGLCEAQEGKRLLMIPPPPIRLPHLSTWDGERWKDHGLRPPWPGRTESVGRRSGDSADQKQTRKRRVNFLLEKNEDPRSDAKYLPGLCSGSLHGDRHLVEEVSMVLNSFSDGQLFALQREYLIRSTRRPTQPVRPRESAQERLAAVLERLCQAGQPLEAEIVQASTQTARLRDLLHDGWPPRLAEIEVADFPFVDSANYSSADEVTLERRADQYVASIRAVPPRDLEGFQALLGLPLNEKEAVAQFYYVGRTEALNESGRDHLFEFGYGLTLRVAETCLLYEGRPFPAAEYVIFHGDRLGKVTFVERVTEKGEPQLCIDVAELSYSHEHQLYRQAKHHSLVHTLHLKLDDGTVRIDTIEGFDDRRLADWSSYRVPRAELAYPAGVAGSEEIAQHHGLEHMTVFGRLDQDVFESSVGYKVVFQRVRFTFDSADGLQNDEKLFLWGETIKSIRNDYFVPLMPPPGFDARDIGEDLASGIPLFRRDFSARESLLRRLATGGREFEPRIFPVAIKREGKNSKARASLLKGSPSRQLTSLRSALRTGAGSRYAVVTDTPGSDQEGEVRVELRPGVFFTLRPQDIERMPSELFRGAVLRLEPGSGGRIALYRCSWGDERYLAGGYRAVLVLPLNALLREEAVARSFDDSWWRRSRTARFTVGGLPNVIAAPSQFNKSENSWNPAMARPMRNLMTTPHPKIGWLARVDDEFLVAPDWGTALAGRLNFDRVPGEVFFERFHTKYDPEPMPWSSVSFLDAGRQRLEDYCRTRGWKYHDGSTGYWQRDSISLQTLEQHTATSGPVFAEFDGRWGLQLRYSSAALSRLGYPAQHLSEAGEKVDIEMPVAAVSVEKGVGIGLWMEVAPGQVVEIPGELITYGVGDRQVPLGRLAWEHFAPGDLVRLRATESGTPAVDSFELAAWRPGPRAALGKEGALLPVESFDEERGELTLGAGAFRLRYPATAQPPVNSVWLQDGNQVRPAERPHLKPGETVLLGTGQRGVIVLGTEGRLAVRHRDPEVWRNDRLGDFLYPSGDDRKDYRDRLRRVIEAVGGALPATIEGFDSDNNVLFSFRGQRADLRPGGWAIATAIGFVAREQQLLVRVGPAVVPLAASGVVEGLPPECAEAVAAALTVSATWLWLNAAPDGRWFPGIGRERQQEGRFDPTCAVSGTGTRHGLVARSQASQRLYWVSSADLARTELTASEVERIWAPSGTGSPPRSFVARVQGAVSPLATREALQELSRLRIGASLRVVVLSEREGGERDGLEAASNGLSSAEPVKRNYLVESHATGVILSCSTERELRVGSLESVEVAWRSWTERPRVVVMPVGERSFHLDAPTWLRSGLPAAGDQRSDFQCFLRWRVEAAEQPLDSHALLDKVDGQELDRRLCHAYEASLRKPLTSAIAGPPLQWLRRRMVDNKEVDLAYPLMAIATLGAALGVGIQMLAGADGHLPLAEAEVMVEAWRTEINKGTARLGQRAMRSLHVEVLVRRWVARRAVGAIDAHTVRLGELEARLKTPLTQADLRWVEQCADSLFLSGEAEWRQLGLALLASLGHGSDLSWLDKESSVLARVIRLWTCLDFVDHLLSPENGRKGVHDEREATGVQRGVQARGGTAGVRGEPAGDGGGPGARRAAGHAAPVASQALRRRARSE